MTGTFRVTHVGKWQIDHLHCVEDKVLLAGFPSETVDLIVTSPPYNLRNSTGGGFSGTLNNKGMWKSAQMAHGYDEYTDDLPEGQYVAWQRDVLTEMMRVLKDNGAIFYNHKWRVQGGLWQRTADDITQGFPVRQIIIWQRAGGMNFNNGYFVPTYEVIYLIAKANFRLKPGANGYGDVWKIPQETGTPHPAPMPYELARRCIDSCDAQLVVDPYCGWGTTALAAANLKRHYIGGDKSRKYIELARERLARPFTEPMFL